MPGHWRRLIHLKISVGSESELKYPELDCIPRLLVTAITKDLQNQKTKAQETLLGSIHMITSIPYRFCCHCTEIPSRSAGVKSSPFGLLPAWRAATVDITGHVKPSLQVLHSADFRSGEFRSETSMVPVLQPHPVLEWAKKNSKLFMLEPYHGRSLHTLFLQHSSRP